MQEAETESITQLADAEPQIDTPLRILLPAGTNAPQRTPSACRDDYIRTNAFSPAAYTVALNTEGDNAPRVGPNSRLPSLPHHSSSKGGDSDAKIKTAISHYTVLAFSCHRAGKSEVEASAYISLAVIYDNMGNYKQGIENYENYLRICTQIADAHGEAVAYNCLGVNYMLLAWNASDEGFLHGFKATEQSLGYIDKAIEYHQNHVNIADQGGKFVAHINLGLCYGVKGEYALAAKHHQSALRIAIKMQTLFGQSIAVGNLGMLAVAKKDFVTARTCFEQVYFKNVLLFIISSRFSIYS